MEKQTTEPLGESRPTWESRAWPPRVQRSPALTALRSIGSPRAMRVNPSLLASFHARAVPPAKQCLSPFLGETSRCS